MAAGVWRKLSTTPLLRLWEGTLVRGRHTRRDLINFKLTARVNTCGGSPAVRDPLPLYLSIRVSEYKSSIHLYGLILIRIGPTNVYTSSRRYRTRSVCSILY